jgi:anaerobic ribonucleoside-triphosphate reductase
MPYRRPSDTEIVDAIKEALRRRGIVNSQRKMRELVLKELRRHDPDYSVSEVRVRKLAIRDGLATVITRGRSSTERTVANSCPVCNGKMKRTKNLTLDGGTVNMGYKCLKCGYWTGLRRRVPTLYVFEPK